MPHDASTITKDPYLLAWLLGFSKIGKTFSTIKSLSQCFGRGYVMSCGPRKGMEKVVEKAKEADFAYDLIKDETSFNAGVLEGRRGVKEKEYNWIFVDDYSMYASWLCQFLMEESARRNSSGLPDGRQYYGDLRARLVNGARRVIDIRTNIVFASHWIEPSPEVKGQRAKSGRGILPLIPGAAREELPALFPDVIFMELEDNRRVFQVSPEGVWGPFCKSVDGTHTIDADFGEFIKLTKGLPTKGSATVQKKKSK